MAKFLATNGISYLIEGIMMDAKESITLLSPCLKFSPLLIHRLREAHERGVEIRIAFAREDCSEALLAKLAHWKGLSLIQVDNLNARCCFNERLMVLSSTDIESFSEKSQREMGVLIDRNEDHLMYMQATLEVTSIINSGETFSVTDQAQAAPAV